MTPPDGYLSAGPTGLGSLQLLSPLVAPLPRRSFFFALPSLFPPSLLLFFLFSFSKQNTPPFPTSL